MTNLQTISDQPAETQIEYRIDCLIRELDELCRIAASGETQDLIGRRDAFTLLRRSALLVNLLASHDQPTFRQSHAA